MQKSRNKKPPIFIVGCSRSGTTLLQSLLDAHPSIAIPPESQIYYRFGETFSYYGDLSVSRNRRQFIQDLVQDAYIMKWGMDFSIDEVERAASAFTREAIVEALFQLYMNEKDAKRWGDKTPEHIRYLPMIREDFPDAHFVHLVRDGRDVAEAFRRMIFGPVSALGLGDTWCREVMHWHEFQEEEGGEGMMEVRYENLVSSPKRVLEEILAFIDEPFVDTTRRYSDSEVINLTGSEPWHSSLQQGITTDKVGIYRERLSERDIEIFEYVAGSALEAYEYRPDYQDPEAPSIYERIHALISDRIVRWYRKLFDIRVFIWDIQFRSRKLLRYFQWVCLKR